MRRKTEGRREDERGRNVQAVCPGLPSPSGVHLVTHPLHRAEYMRGREGEEERDRLGESKRERETEGYTVPTCTLAFPFYNIRANGQGNERCAGNNCH